MKLRPSGDFQFEREFGLLDIQEHTGWVGCFTTKHIPGAMANGQRVVKINSEGPDETPDGTLGTILGSLPPLPDGEARQMSGRLVGVYGYFVEWDSKPKQAILVMGFKLEPDGQVGHA